MNNADDHQPTTPTPVAQRSDEMPPIRFGLLAGIGVTLFAMMGAVAASVVLDVKQSAPQFQVLLGLSLLALMLLPTVYIARTQSLPLRDLFRLRSASPLVFLGVIVGVIALSVVLQAYTIFQELYLVPDELRRLYFRLNSRTQESIISLVSASDVWGLLTALFSIALAPAISEEFLFRGLVQRSFERRMRPLTAIALAGVMFGSVHLQPQNGVALVVLGIFFGYVTWASNSIFPAVFGHFMFNAQTIVGLFFTGEGAMDTTAAHTERDLQDLLPFALSALLIVIVIIYWLGWYRKARQTAESITTEQPPDTSLSDNFPIE